MIPKLHLHISEMVSSADGIRSTLIDNSNLFVLYHGFQDEFIIHQKRQARAYE
jgi:hypothetical protein